MPALAAREIARQEAFDHIAIMLRFLDNEDSMLLEDQAHNSDRDRSDVSMTSTSDSGGSSMSSVSSISSVSSVSSLSSSSSSSSLSSAGSEGSSAQGLDARGYLLQERAEFLRLMTLHLNYINTVRVLHPGTVPKLSQLHLVLVDYKLRDPKRFRRNVRVSPTTFDALLLRICNHQVFQSDSNCPQMEPCYQLATALYRFGHFGNSSSVEAVAQWAGVAAGTVVKFTHRVMEAFLSVSSQAVRWPSRSEKERAKEWVEEVSCSDWRNGFCFVDGTLIPLADKPGHHGEQYFDRKSNYSLNLQLISLPNLRIIDFTLGHCGSTHDSTAFKSSRTYKEHGSNFYDDEWIWADSAYPTLKWIVTPYKRPLADMPDNKTFNYWVSRVRVKSEHAVGYLKGRMSSLRGLRQQIIDERSHELALAWVQVCIIIHTLVSRIEDGNEDPEWQNECIRRGVDVGGAAGDEEIDDERYGKVAGNRWRESLKGKLFESGIASRG